MNVYYRGMATVTDQPGKWRNIYGDIEHDRGERPKAILQASG